MYLCGKRVSAEYSQIILLNEKATLQNTNNTHKINNNTNTYRNAGSVVFITGIITAGIYDENARSRLRRNRK